MTLSAPENSADTTRPKAESRGTQVVPVPFLPRRRMLTSDHASALPALRQAMPSRWARRIGHVLLLAFFAAPFILLFVPWQQSILGAGRVIAFAPLDRQQTIQAPIAGRVSEVWVTEGTTVKKGDRILLLTDNDPQLVDRLRQQRDALLQKHEAAVAKLEHYTGQVEHLIDLRDLLIAAARERLGMSRERVKGAEQTVQAAQAALDTAKLNNQRQSELLKSGLTSKRDFELAELTYNQSLAAVVKGQADTKAAENDVASNQAQVGAADKDANAKIDSARATKESAASDLASVNSELVKLDVEIARVQSQLVTAPRDGVILRLMTNESSDFIKAGDPLAILVPDTVDRAVELWVNGIDAPLIQPGAENVPVRLQFEGWPAVQFSGWPSVAVGTFGGRVALVDATDDGKGKFRVLVIPDPDLESDPRTRWPETRYLRQGVRANGWVLLSQVSLGWELWRKINGFPPVVAHQSPEKSGGIKANMGK